MIAGNGYLLFHGVDLIEEARGRLLGLSTQFWIDLAIEFAKVIGIFVAAGVLVRWIRKLLDALARRATGYKNVTANDASIETFFASLNRIQKIAIWLLAAYFAVSILPFQPGAGYMLLLLLRVYLIIAVGMLALKAVAAIVQSLEALVAGAPEPEKLLGLYDRLRDQMPLMRRCLEAVVYVMVATLVMAQVDFIAEYQRRLAALCRVPVESRTPRASNLMTGIRTAVGADADLVVIGAPLETGTGLGLALCRRNVSLLGGHIRCTGMRNGGSCFSVALPAALQGEDRFELRPPALATIRYRLEIEPTTKGMLRLMLDSFGIEEDSRDQGPLPDTESGLVVTIREAGNALASERCELVLCADAPGVEPVRLAAPLLPSRVRRGLIQLALAWRWSAVSRGAGTG